MYKLNKTKYSQWKTMNDLKTVEKRNEKMNFVCTRLTYRNMRKYRRKQHSKKHLTSNKYKEREKEIIENVPVSWFYVMLLIVGV